MSRRPALCVAALLCLIPPALAHAQCTPLTWIAERGDWATGASWSGGALPTLGDCVTIADDDTVDVTLAGAVCGELTVADQTPGAIWIWPGGELTVSGSTVFGDGAYGGLLQVGGSVDLGALEVGIGAYTMSAGDLTLGAALLGTTAIQGALQINGGAAVVTQSLQLTTTGWVFAGGGTLDVQGTGITSAGRISLSGGTVTATTYTAQTGNILGVNISPLGMNPLEVGGTAILTGTLSVLDLGAAEGTYDVLRADTIVGAFAPVLLPDGWTWGQESDRVWVKKGQDVATGPTSWGGVKARYDDASGLSAP